MSAETPVPVHATAHCCHQDDKYAAYGLPNGSFKGLHLETCKAPSSKQSCASNAAPLVLFSGALATSRLIYNSMLKSIAAAGYCVISIDHPYNSDVVEFPDGTMTTGIDISSDADLVLALTKRTEDNVFVRQQMSNATVANKLFPGHLFVAGDVKAAVLGHSFGGAAAASTMLQEPLFIAGLNLDGSMFGPVLQAGLDRPFMLLGHENKTRATDPSWKAIWPQLKGWKKEFEVKHAAHYSFSDLPLITAVFGFQGKLPEDVGQVLGSVEVHHMMELIITYTTMFLDTVFKNGTTEELSGGNNMFPEVFEVA